MHAVESGSIKKGEKTVVVLRYLGPKGGPGACFILPLFFLSICAWLHSLVFHHYPLSHTHTLLLCLYEAITLPSLAFPTTTRYLFCFSILLFESGVPNLDVDRLTERTLTRSRPASFFSSHGGPDWLERHAFRNSPPYIHAISVECPTSAKLGMPEMLKPTSLIMGAGLGHDVACLTDGRFSGG